MQGGEKRAWVGAVARMDFEWDKEAREKQCRAHVCDDGCGNGGRVTVQTKNGSKRTNVCVLPLLQTPLSGCQASWAVCVCLDASIKQHVCKEARCQARRVPKHQIMMMMVVIIKEGQKKATALNERCCVSRPPAVHTNNRFGTSDHLEWSSEQRRKAMIYLSLAPFGAARSHPCRLISRAAFAASELQKGSLCSASSVGPGGGGSSTAVSRLCVYSVL